MACIITPIVPLLSCRRLFASTTLIRTWATFATSAVSTNDIKRTALYDFHVAQGGKMVPFAGWLLPLTYSNQSHVQSHIHTRNKASLFDVSHMLQTRWTGCKVIDFMESLVVSDIRGLAPGVATLSLFTTPTGGIIDDTVIQRLMDPSPILYVVSNAGCADKDLAHFHTQLKLFTDNFTNGRQQISIEHMSDYSLLAFQGPSAVRVLEDISDQSLSSLLFMHGIPLTIKGIPTYVTRCGYTGEDGVEISVENKHVSALADIFIQHKDVALAGLAARDSLRLEAGLCLYGHDMDDTVSPVEASLLWTISKRRRTDANFIGSQAILPQIGGPITKRRVGLIVQGAPAREGAKIVDLQSGDELGQVTSGMPSPTLKKNIAMGYVKGGFLKARSKVGVIVRGKTQPAEVVKMPFVPHQYYRG